MCHPLPCCIRGRYDTRDHGAYFLLSVRVLRERAFYGGGMLQLRQREERSLQLLRRRWHQSVCLKMETEKSHGDLEYLST